MNVRTLYQPQFVGFDRLSVWEKKRGLSEGRYIQCPMICVRQLPPHLRRGRCGTTSRRLRAMSGFAGLLRARKRKRGISVSRRGFQSSKGACAAPAAGRAVFIVETAALGGVVDFVLRFHCYVKAHYVYSSSDLAFGGSGSSLLSENHRELFL